MFEQNKNKIGKEKPGARAGLLRSSGDQLLYSSEIDRVAET